MAENVWARIVGSASSTPLGDATNPLVIAESVATTKAAVFNTALPAAEASLLTTGLTPTNATSYFQISVAIATAGVFRVSITRSGTTIVMDMWQGANLQANSLYTFPLAVRTGDTVNFRYSATEQNILMLRVEEVTR
jgi:hypothetical protein